MTRDNAFIVTKPLQILVATSIIKQLGIEKNSRLIVTNSFYNAKMVSERMAAADWSLRDLRFTYKSSIKEGYHFIKKNRIKNVYIDTDVGFQKYIDLAQIKLGRNDTHIYVYEEGIGTYRTDLYYGIKKHIFDILGVGTTFGACSLTDGIYVFDDERYNRIFPNQRTLTIKISCGVQDIIAQDFERWAYIMNYSPMQYKNNSACNVYLSSWNLDSVFLRAFQEMDGDKFIKPHPHIKHEVALDFVKTIAQTAPAELILTDLANKYFEVNVFHHGSSVENYLSFPNINFHKIPINCNAS